VATILNDLAAVDFVQHHYAAAERMYRRALAIREKSLGPDHPHVLVIRQNLAELERAWGPLQGTVLAFRR
jgi:hypothetical protein